MSIHARSDRHSMFIPQFFDFYLPSTSSGYISPSLQVVSVLALPIKSFSYLPIRWVFVSFVPLPGSLFYLPTLRLSVHPFGSQQDSSPSPPLYFSLGVFASRSLLSTLPSLFSRVRFGVQKGAGVPPGGCGDRIGVLCCLVIVAGGFVVFPPGLPPCVVVRLFPGALLTVGFAQLFVRSGLCFPAGDVGVLLLAPPRSINNYLRRSSVGLISSIFNTLRVLSACSRYCPYPSPAVSQQYWLRGLRCPPRSSGVVVGCASALVLSRVGFSMFGCRPSFFFSVSGGLPRFSSLMFRLFQCRFAWFSVAPYRGCRNSRSSDCFIRQQSSVQRGRFSLGLVIMFCSMLFPEALRESSVRTLRWPGRDSSVVVAQKIGLVGSVSSAGFRRFVGSAYSPAFFSSVGFSFKPHFPKNIYHLIVGIPSSLTTFLLFNAFESYFLPEKLRSRVA